VRDIVGFIALAFSLIGMTLLARKNRHGWKLRVLAGSGWITYACMLDAAPMLAASATFMLIDLYGLHQHRSGK